MLVVASDRHRLHAPIAEIESSGLQSPFEHPGRADAIRATLSADDRFTVVEPDNWGAEVISAVHDPGLVEFLERAWRDYQLRHPGTHDVVPDVFAVPGLVDGIGPFPRRGRIDFELGQWCFETTTPLTEGTFDAARSAVDVALTATSAVLDGEPSALRALSAARAPCADGALRRLLLLQQRGDRRPSRRGDDGLEGDGARRRLPPRQRHPADLLRTQRRAVRLAARRSGARVSVRHGLRRRDRSGPRAWHQPQPAARRRAPTTTATSTCSATRSTAISAFGPELVLVSLGVDTFHNDPISDLAITTDGFRRQGELVAELGLPDRRAPGGRLRRRRHRPQRRSLSPRSFGGQLTNPSDWSHESATASASSSSMPTRRFSSVSSAVSRLALIVLINATKASP